MITELICYKCKCSKCNHLWTTKGHELPKACPNPKCKRITWNDDFDFSKAQIDASAIKAAEPVQIAEPSNEYQSKLEKAREALKSVESRVSVPIVEEIDQWQGWTDEQQTYDDQTGDMRTFRRHIKTGRVKWLDAETALISV